MNISCAFVSIILISFPLQSRAETENRKRYGMRGHGGRRGEMERGMTVVGVRNKRDERGG